MANRKTTQYWEENKPVYPLYLCYSQDKGLYANRLTENENSDGLLYRPQGFIGFVNDKITIPGQEVEIEIWLIHQFMCESKAGTEYLSMILDKEV